MRIGALREIKPMERQVALAPGATGHLTALDHAVLVETGIGTARPRPRS
jgi:alanine dehydrogenase